LSMTLPIVPRIALSACGPPVEHPINRTRGVAGGNGRNAILPASGAPAAMAGVSRKVSLFRFNRASNELMRADEATRPCLRREPRTLIFSISSRRNDSESRSSRSLSGFGI